MYGSAVACIVGSGACGMGLAPERWPWVSLREVSVSLCLLWLFVRWQHPCRLDAEFKPCLSPALSQQSP